MMHYLLPKWGLSLLLSITLAGVSFGCSAYMAAVGAEEPDMAYLQQGATRTQVEKQLTKVVEVVQLSDGGRRITYEYEMGNKPSVGRAAGYIILDLLTWGFYEILFSGVEAAGGQKFKITIQYDQNQRVVLVGDPIEITLAGSHIVKLRKV